jgi:hypothetical protein
MIVPEPGEWVLWLVRPHQGRVTVRIVGRFSSQGAAVRHGVRLGRATAPGAVRYYVREAGRHLPRDPARYAWVPRDGGVVAGGRAPARR